MAFGRVTVPGLKHWSGVRNGLDNSFKKALTTPRSGDLDFPNGTNRFEGSLPGPGVNVSWQSGQVPWHQKCGDVY